MLPISFQKKNEKERKEIVSTIVEALKNIDQHSYPNIYRLIKSGNSKKESVIDEIITQMVSLDYNINNSLLAVEENN